MVKLYLKLKTGRGMEKKLDLVGKMLVGRMRRTMQQQIGHPLAQGRFHYSNGYNFLANPQTPYNDNVRTEVWINGVSFSNDTSTEGYIETCGGNILDQYYGDNDCTVIGEYPDFTYQPINLSGEVLNPWGSSDGLYGGVLNTIPMNGSSDPIKEYYLISNGNVVRYVIVPYSHSGLILDQVLNRDTDINVSQVSTDNVTFQAFDSDTFLDFSIEYTNVSGTMYATNTTIQYGFTKTSTPTGNGYYRRTYYEMSAASAKWISSEIGYTSSVPTKTTITSGNDRGVTIDGIDNIFDTASDGISYDSITTDAWGLTIINSTLIAVNNATYVNDSDGSVSLPTSPYSGLLTVNTNVSTTCSITSSQVITSDLDCTGQTFFVSNGANVYTTAGAIVYCDVEAIEIGSSFSGDIVVG